MRSQAVPPSGADPRHREAKQVGVLLGGDGRVVEKLNRGHVVDAGDPDRALRDLRRPRERCLRSREADQRVRVRVDVRDTRQRRAEVLAVEQHLGRRAEDLSTAASTGRSRRSAGSASRGR